MILKTILTIAAIHGISSTTLPAPSQNSRKPIIVNAKNDSRDSLPPLHTIKENDIKSVTTSFETQDITVTLKDSITYTYHNTDWDMEEYYPSLNKKLREAIRNVKMIFTRVEHPAEFPGGSIAWEKYITEFCKQYNEEIKKSGAADITIQFIVHLNGQITDLDVVSNPNQSNLDALAKKALLEGPSWVPATQNTYPVVSYQKQTVKLG